MLNNWIKAQKSSNFDFLVNIKNDKDIQELHSKVWNYRK